MTKKRFFKCKCHYSLRFGTRSCPYCFKPTPVYNRLGFWVVIVFAAVFGLMMSVGVGFDEGEETAIESER